MRAVREGIRSKDLDPLGRTPPLGNKRGFIVVSHCAAMAGPGAVPLKW
jgi:hypothetical protein